MNDKTRKITFSLGETKQTVNLKELLGRRPTKADKDLFASKAIDKIIDRTQSGKPLIGKKFKPYTKDYAELKGVSRTDVDMTLEGDMLEALKRLGGSGDNVNYGIRGGVEAKKSFNHNTGDTLEKRTWFGLTKGEMKEIASEMKSPSQRLSSDDRARLLDAADSLRLEQDG